MSTTKTIEPCYREYSHGAHYHGELKDNIFCEGIDKQVEIPESIIEDIQYRLHMYNRATDKTNEGHHLIELFNHVSDLASYHTGYNDKNGMLPWEYDEDYLG